MLQVKIIILQEARFQYLSKSYRYHIIYYLLIQLESCHSYIFFCIIFLLNFPVRIIVIPISIK